MAEPTSNDAVGLMAGLLIDDDDVLLSKQHADQENIKTEFQRSRVSSFASEFLFEFDSFGSSAESTENDESSDDEEDFLAGLTRRLSQSTGRQNRVMASSPQSTLSGLVSWSASSKGSPDGPSLAPSPLTVPYCNEKDESLLRRTFSTDPPPSGFYSNQNFPRNPNQNMRQEQVIRKQIQTCIGRCGVLQSAWQQPRPLYPAVAAMGVSGTKRQCTGTGVFLPRTYSNPSGSRKKSGCSSVLLPAKVVQTLNLEFDNTTNSGQDNGAAGFVLDYDSLMARRNACLSGQKTSLRPDADHTEVPLPKEWIY